MSGRGNVFRGKCPGRKMSGRGICAGGGMCLGENVREGNMSGRGNVFRGKCPGRERTGRENVREGYYVQREMSGLEYVRKAAGNIREGMCLGGMSGSTRPQRTIRRRHLKILLHNSH